MKRWSSFDPMPAPLPTRMLFGVYTFSLMFLGLYIAARGTLQFIVDRTGSGFMFFGVLLFNTSPLIARIFTTLTLSILRKCKKLFSFLED